MTKGAIGAEGFREQMDKKTIKIKRPRRGRPRKKIVCINSISQNNMRTVPIFNIDSSSSFVILGVFPSEARHWKYPA